MSDFDLKPTNTLAMASLDALKNEGLEDPKINSNISKLATLDLDESYMIKTINFSMEFRNRRYISFFSIWVAKLVIIFLYRMCFISITSDSDNVSFIYGNTSYMYFLEI